MATSTRTAPSARRRDAARDADPTQQRVAALTREQTRVATAMERLVTAYQQDLLTLEDLRTRMPALRSQQQAIAAEVQALETAAVDQARYLRLTETLTDFGARLRAHGETLDIAERQTIVRLLISEIRIGSDAITICHSLPVGRPGPGEATPPTGTPTATASGGGPAKWLLHVRGQGARLRPGQGARVIDDGRCHPVADDHEPCHD